MTNNIGSSKTWGPQNQTPGIQNLETMMPTELVSFSVLARLYLKNSMIQSGLAPLYHQTETDQYLYMSLVIPVRSLTTLIILCNIL
jgi:hypothetical protein